MAARLSAPAGAYAVPQNSEINVTPFVDIMLVLLIVMMVAIPAATVSHDLDLAQAAAAPVPAQATLVVTLEDTGALTIGADPSRLETLIADLKARGASPEQEVYVQAERAVPYERFMALVNVLKTGGYSKLGLVGEEL